MMERIYALAEADIDTFVGTNRANLITLSNLFPKTKLRLHQNVLKILGEDQAVEELMHVLSALEQLCSEYNQLTEAQIIETVRRLRSGQEGGGQPSASDVIIYGIHGKAIQARGRAQQRLVSDFGSCDLCFATGAAGSGKTFIAICLAVKALKEKTAKKIILSRPAVEAGEKLGFLPGDMKDKIDPYLQPLYDALEDMIPAVKLQDMMEKHVIQIAPLAFMRGRTLSDAVVILDEVVGIGEDGGTVDSFAAIDEVTIVGGAPTNGHPGEFVTQEVFDPINIIVGDFVGGIVETAGIVVIVFATGLL